MVLSGPPTAIGGSQNVSASLLRPNSGMLGVEGGPVAPESTFSSLVSARPQLSNINMLGNVSNVSSLLGGQGQPFGNGGSVSVQRGNIDSGAELDPLAGIGNGLGYSSGNPTTSGQFQGQQLMMPNQSLSQQIETQTFQHSQQQFSAPPKTQGQHQFPTSLGPVKLEPQMINEQLGPHNTQQFQSMKNLGHVKLEGITSTRNLGPVKMESPHTNQQSLYLQQQQQQQQQQFLQITRPPSQAAAAQYLQQQQRIFQLQQQQQQQQQLLKVPQQRGQLGQQFQQQNLAVRSPMRLVYEPGMCAKRVTHYMYQQQRRPDDNNIDFWRKFVNEYFAPNAKKKWCVSMYGSGRQTAGVFPQDVWHCDICNQKPGRGFEATSEVLPRLFKIKYESGTLEELLYVDMPREYQNSSGQIVLDYAKAIQESLFEQLRVVREGQLRIVFSLDLKICSWEFCARRHEELIPRRLLIPQVSQLGAASQKYQAVTQNASPTVPELQNNCNMFLSSARQLAKALEVPLVNDLGYTKRYVRCLQISEVVNCMKDLIDYSRQTGAGPMESLAKFPRRTGTTSVVPPGQGQLSEEQSQKQRLLQQPTPVAHQNTTNVDQTSLQPGSMHPPTSNGVVSSSAIAGLLHQNSMNSRQQQSSVPNVGSPYGNSSSSFQSPTHSSSGNNPPLPEISMQQQRENSEPSNGASTAQKIYQEMMSNQHNGLGGGIVGRVHGSLGTDVKHANGVVPAMGMGLSQNQTTLVNGLRAAMNSSGRVGMNWERTMSLQHQHQQQQQQELSNQMLNGLGPVSSGFNSLQYDWKPSP